MSRLLKNYPKYYEGIIEIDELCKVEDNMLSEISNDIKIVNDNQFVLTSNEVGIKAYENILQIVPDTKLESLDFRRRRILNRISVSLPFTLKFLRKKLDEIVGKNNYKIYFDYNNHTLYIESSAKDQQWFGEIYITINNIKPCNIVFINKPLNNHMIFANEDISANDAIYNYTLGAKWVLGKEEFRIIKDKGGVKLTTVSSLKRDLFVDIIDFIISDIAKVKINNTLDITNINVTTNGDLGTIEYTISKDDNISEVTNIKIYNADDELLSESTVYVPVINDLILKHNFRVKEGV